MAGMYLSWPSVCLAQMTLDLITALYQNKGIVAYSCNLTMWEVETERSEVQVIFCYLVSSEPEKLLLKV